MKKPSRKQANTDLPPLAFDHLIETDLPEWDSPLVPSFLVPYPVVESIRKTTKAVWRFLKEAPPEEVSRFRAMEQKVKDQGGWTSNDPEQWKVLLSLLLYDDYREQGEQIVLKQLPGLLQMDALFFKEQWWVKDLHRLWRQQGEEGKRKWQRLQKRERGDRESLQEKAARWQRNRPLVEEVDRRLEENRAREINTLLHEAERLEGDRRRERTRNRILDKISELQDPRVRVGYRAVLRQVVADQEQFGCRDHLGDEAIRKIYELAKSQLRQR